LQMILNTNKMTDNDSVFIMILETFL